MRILYYSVHQILEDDEVRLFQALGHDVCCLGTSSPTGALTAFREAIPFNEQERELYAAFARLGGVFRYGRESGTHHIPPAFVDLFDVVIVMHAADFIVNHWDALSRRPVVWRTIGQAIEHLEVPMRQFRESGMKIVRYSPIEAAASTHIGSDATIRFFKSPDVYHGWTGETAQFLTFSNLYKDRYPEDAKDYIEISEGITTVLGGAHNEGMPGAIGMVTSQEQENLYRQSRAYLYGHGLAIPYTLNFMEAWMTGIPMVVHAPLDRRGMFFEIDQLITDGVDGYISRDVATTRTRLQALIDDRDLAARIGAAGRERAKKLFSIEHAREQWTAFLESVAPTAVAAR